MQALDETGHTYALESAEGGPPQRVRFIHRQQSGGKLVTVCDGTTNEDVLAVLIDRTRQLDAHAPCVENAASRGRPRQKMSMRP